MIASRIFTEQINRLTGVFGQAAFSADRVRRIYQLIGDLPPEAIAEIVSGFIDNSRYAPLPKDFLEAAKEWKKQYHLKTGQFWGYQSRQTVQPEIECQRCLDAGLLHIQVPDGDYSLCRCDCTAGVQTTSQLPVWSADMASLFVASPLPVKWVKPTSGNIEDQIRDRVALLRKEMKRAMKLWGVKQ